jgi:large subunit ribosomal protein L21
LHNFLKFIAHYKKVNRNIFCFSILILYLQLLKKQRKNLFLQFHQEFIKEIMYAIVEIAGQQFKVQQDQYVYTHRLAFAIDADVTFDKVMLVDNEGAITIGAPTISGATVTGKILSHLKGDKVIVFKKKRRKGYRRKNGHRQYLTKVLISGISLN